MLAEEPDEQPDVALMHESFEKLGEISPATFSAGEMAPPPCGAEAEGEPTLLQYFASCGLSSRVLDLADAIFANDYGADMSDVGLHEVMHEQRHWTYGEKYLVLRGACLQDAMESLGRGLDVRTAWRVQRIDASPTGWGADGAAVELSAADGRVVRARACVVTVPLSVLQRGEPEFRPPLPPPQAGAIRKLKMGSALKVIVRLRRRFWPADFYDAVCSDSFLPEVWLSPAAARRDRRAARDRRGGARVLRPHPPHRRGGGARDRRLAAARPRQPRRPHRGGAARPHALPPRAGAGLVLRVRRHDGAAAHALRAARRRGGAAAARGGRDYRADGLLPLLPLCGGARAPLCARAPRLFSWSSRVARDPA